MFCFDFVFFSRLLDFIELKIGFRLKSDFREKEFMFLNRESLDQVSNSKVFFCLVFVLDFLMAEQQPENKAALEEKEVQPQLMKLERDPYPKREAKCHLLQRQTLLI